jgi:hypothetical protein
MSKFSVGDRVRIKLHAVGVIGGRRGTVGTVTSRDRSAGYYVQCHDGVIGYANESELELVDQLTAEELRARLTETENLLHKAEELSKQHARQRNDAMRQRDTYRVNHKAADEALGVMTDQRDYWKSERDGFAKLWGQSNSRIEELEELLEVSKAQVTQEAERAVGAQAVADSAAALLIKAKEELADTKGELVKARKTIECLMKGAGAGIANEMRLEARVRRLEGLEAERIRRRREFFGTR